VDMKFGKTTCRSEKVSWAKALSRGGVCTQKAENTVFTDFLSKFGRYLLQTALRPTELVEWSAPVYRRLFQVCRCSLCGA
jgi:hypothetical protein